MGGTQSKTATPLTGGLPREISNELNRFLSSIKEIQYFKPDGNPNIEWKVFYGSTLTEAREAARRVAKDKTWNAAHDTARRAARDAGRGEVSDAAYHAAFRSAWNVAGEVVIGMAKWDAARDAALTAELIVIKDLDFPGKEKHITYASKMIEAWKKGYGFAGDADNVFCVYCAAKQPERINLRSPATNLQIPFTEFGTA